MFLKCAGTGGTLSLPLYILLGSPLSNWNRSNNYAYPSSSKPVSSPGLTFPSFLMLDIGQHTVILEINAWLKKMQMGSIYSIWVKMLVNKCEQSNTMRIEDSNKDNYEQNSEQFDHKCTCTYIIHKCTYKFTLTMTECNLCSRKTRRCTVVACLVFIVLLLWILHACVLSIHSPDDVFMAR